jgi:hypothetical protein
MVKKFSAQIDDFITKSEKRMVALVRASVEELVDRTQTPTGRGGRMRIDTGFLRASGQMQLNGLPSGPSRNIDGENFEWDRQNITLTLASVDLGDRVFFGWTADYAIYRETYDGFLGANVQNWQQIVDAKVLEMRQRIG